MLTDGEVSSPDRVVALAAEAATKASCKIHTFGVGSDCSVDLVTRVAAAGKGICSLVRDTQDLRGVVIDALAKSLEPQYSKVEVKFN